jgi:murein DD-endopeptidase MepM/ murein hydrolase activator NlpD
MKLAIGPLAKTPETQEEIMGIAEEGRNPAAITQNPASSVFFSKPLLETHEGELARTGESGYHSLSIRIDRAIRQASLREQGVLELWETLSVQQSLIRATPSLKPTRGWYTSPFGYRMSPYTGAMALHTGLDIAATPGTPIYAPADGVVSFSGYDGGYGKLLSIDHGYGVVTRYGHNSELYVTVGQKVKRGDLIAAVGNTGRSTASHLHYEVRVNGLPVDPENYILE